LKSNPDIYLASACCVVHADFFLGLVFNLEYGGDTPPKYWLTFRGQHGVITQKTDFFMLCWFLDSFNDAALSARVIQRKMALLREYE
jgi:hypothetical protein